MANYQDLLLNKKRAEKKLISIDTARKGEIATAVNTINTTYKDQIDAVQEKLDQINSRITTQEGKDPVVPTA